MPLIYCPVCIVVKPFEARGKVFGNLFRHIRRCHPNAEQLISSIYENPEMVSSHPGLQNATGSTVTEQQPVEDTVEQNDGAVVEEAEQEQDVGKVRAVRKRHSRSFSSSSSDDGQNVRKRRQRIRTCRAIKESIASFVATKTTSRHRKPATPVDALTDSDEDQLLEQPKRRPKRTRHLIISSEEYETSEGFETIAETDFEEVNLDKGNKKKKAPTAATGSLIEAAVEVLKKKKKAAEQANMLTDNTNNNSDKAQQDLLAGISPILATAEEEELLDSPAPALEKMKENIDSVGQSRAAPGINTGRLFTPPSGEEEDKQQEEQPLNLIAEQLNQYESNLDQQLATGQDEEMLPYPYYPVTPKPQSGATNAISMSPNAFAASSEPPISEDQTEVAQQHHSMVVQESNFFVETPKAKEVAMHGQEQMETEQEVRQEEQQHPIPSTPASPITSTPASPDQPKMMALEPTRQMNISMAPLSKSMERAVTPQPALSTGQHQQEEPISTPDQHQTTMEINVETTPVATPVARRAAVTSKVPAPPPVQEMLGGSSSSAFGAFLPPSFFPPAPSGFPMQMLLYTPYRLANSCFLCDRFVPWLLQKKFSRAVCRACVHSVGEINVEIAIADMVIKKEQFGVLTAVASAAVFAPPPGEMLTAAQAAALGDEVANSSTNIAQHQINGSSSSSGSHSGANGKGQNGEGSGSGLNGGGTEMGNE